MVYESDFYTTRRPYSSRPNVSSYSVTVRANAKNNWNSVFCCYFLEPTIIIFVLLYPNEIFRGKISQVLWLLVFNKDKLFLDHEKKKLRLIVKIWKENCAQKV